MDIVKVLTKYDAKTQKRIWKKADELFDLSETMTFEQCLRRVLRGMDEKMFYAYEAKRSVIAECQDFEEPESQELAELAKKHYHLEKMTEDVAEMLTSHGL